MKGKFISAIIVLAMICICFTVTTFADASSPGAAASDTPSAWAAAQVEAAIAVNLVPAALQSGYAQPTTRAEFAALAVALHEMVVGREIAPNILIMFTDTLDMNVYKAATIGVVEGVGGGRFDPDAELTREQAALMLSRLADAAGSPLTGRGQGVAFADEALISDWAFGAVRQMRTAGIMSGVGENMFAPQDSYTREQSIVTIERLYGMISESRGSMGIRGVLFDDRNRMADARMNLIIETLKNEDKDALKAMFSKQALSEADDFDENIDTLFNYVQGGVQSFETTGAYSGATEINAGSRKKEVKSVYVIVTDEQEYEIAICEYTVDTANPDNVGVYSICIINREDKQEPDVRYWGNGEAGINIG